jgi:uncharacterized tellurite resistance protein B-like protein
MEKVVGDELYELIDGKIIEYIINEGKIESQKDVIRMIHQGQTLSVTERLMPDLYALCYEVKKRLCFEENIDFYVVNSPEINAYAIARDLDKQSHTIAINSGLIERFNEKELMFIIGHEIGHLISGTAKLDNIINFVFPENKSVPLAFENKRGLWKNLSELTADRFGYIASPDINVIAGGFFKMASGLNINNFSFSPSAYLEEIGKTLNYFKEQPYSILGSHPINPVRIEAIRLFAQSDLYKAIQKNQDNLFDDSKLHEGTDELISILLSLFESEFDMHVANFIAASGIIVASADEDVRENEIDTIVDTLSKYTIFPKRYLESIIEDENINELLQNSIKAILEAAPEYYLALIGYLMDIIMADKRFDPQELEILFTITENYMEISRRETVRIIGEIIREEFVPRIYLN